MEYVITILKILLVSIILMICVSICVSFVNWELYIPFQNEVSRLTLVLLLIPATLIVKLKEEFK